MVEQEEPAWPIWLAILVPGLGAVIGGAALFRRRDRILGGYLILVGLVYWPAIYLMAKGLR